MKSKLSPRYQISLRKMLRQNSHNNANEYSCDPTQYQDDDIQLSTVQQIDTCLEYFTYSDRKEWIQNQSQHKSVSETRSNNQTNKLSQDKIHKQSQECLLQKQSAQLYFTSSKQIKKIDSNDNLHVLVSLYGDKFLTTLFDGLIIHMVQETYGHEMKIDHFGTIQRIMNCFGLNPLKLAQLSNIEEQKQYIYVRAGETINQLLKDWQMKIDKRQMQLKLTEEQIKLQCKQNQQIDYDIFSWLQLKTKFKSLKKKLRSKLIEKLSEYENQILVLKKSQNDLQLKGIEKMKTSIILKRSDTFIRKLFSSLRAQKYIENSSPVKKQVNSNEDQQIWNDDLELKFLKNRQYAKINYFHNIICSNFNQMGFLPLVQEMNLTNQKKMKRETKMDKHLNGEHLSEVELKFIADTSELLNKCVDRKMIQMTINKLDQNQIEALETNLSEEIIENYESMVSIVHKARFVYLQQKNDELNKLTSDKVEFYKKEKQQTLNRKLLQKEKKKFESVIRKYQNQGYIRLNTNFYVKMFAHEVMQRINKIRIRKSKNHPLQTQQRENNRAIKSITQTKIIRPQKSRELHPPSKLCFYSPDEEEKIRTKSRISKYRLEIHSKSPKIKQDFIHFYSNGPELPSASKPFYYNKYNQNTQYKKSRECITENEMKCIIRIQKAYKSYYHRKNYLKLKEIDFQNKLQYHTDKLVKYYQSKQLYKVVSKLKSTKNQNQKSFIPDIQIDRLNPRRNSVKSRDQSFSQSKQKLKHKKLLLYSRTNNFTMIRRCGDLLDPDDVNILDEDLKSPLWYAIEKQNMELVNWLVKQGADVNQKCQKGQTPFHCAFKTQNLETIFALYQAGGDLNVIDDQGQTALAYGNNQLLTHFQFNEGTSNRALKGNQQKDNNTLWFRKKQNTEPQYQDKLVSTTRTSELASSIMYKN